MDLSPLHSGDLLFCSGTNFVGEVIEQVTKSRWSHVGIILKLQDVDQWMVLESREPMGCRLVPLSSYDDYDGEVWTASIRGADPGTLPAAINWGFSRLGDSYDFEEIKQLFDHFVWGTTLSNEDPGKDHRQICSVFANLFCRARGITLYDQPVCSPGQLAENKNMNWNRLK